MSALVRSRVTRHRARRLIASFVAIVVVVGCGSSSHRYVANKNEKIYVKVPREWQDYTFDETDPDRLEQITSQATVVWRTAAAPYDDSGTPGQDRPLMYMAVYELSGELNQQMSASLARVAGSPIGFDPVLPQDETQSDRVEVLAYAPLDFEDMSGTRAVFRSRDDAMSDWTNVYSLSTAYDSSAFRLYVLQIGCNVECFESNETAISTVANSWLVKP
ncbi:MAG: hypothetical protein EB010_04970 [Acidimicrobiia bacterium]|nr:hypothetical protein [Acidimicrobiia bacterium]NDF32099.1 hypothetical protein [Acidimicrobiia bacterium]